MSAQVTGSRLYVFGAGGLGREVAWLALECLGADTDLGFVVDKPEYLSEPVNGVPVSLLQDIDPSTGGVVLALGDPQHRKAAAEACEQHGLTPVSLIHPRVERSPWLSLGPGAVVCAGSILTTNVTAGEHLLVNMDCTVAHDAWLGDFVTLAPGVHVSGHVTIEDGAYIGTGATIINGQAGDRLTIGAGAVVAAGACVTKSVEPGALVAGVPAVRKR